MSCMSRLGVLLNLFVLGDDRKDTAPIKSPMSGVIHLIAEKGVFSIGDDGG